MKKTTQKELISKLKKHYKEYNYNYSKIKYINSDTRIIITCPKHGDFTIFPYKLFKNNLHICSKCKKEQLNIRVINNETFIKKANLIHNNKYDYSNTEYKGNNFELDIICPIHGKFTTKADYHLSGHKGCSKCKKHHQLDIDTVLERFKEIHGNKYDYNKFNKYETVYNEIEIKCIKHGYYKQKIFNHLQGHGCKKCGIENIRKSHNSYIENVKEIHGNKYNYDKTEYKHSQEKLIITCNKHGDFKQTARDHLRGLGCMQCGIENRDKISSYEKEIYEFLKPIYSGIIIPNYRDKKEIDIYLPEHNLGIEINGNYWHSHLIKKRKYHFDKSKYFKDKNIQIFHVWEHQWLDINKKEIIKSMILNKLGLTSNKIYARKCIIKEILPKEYREFLNNNHIQGNVNSKIKLGLYYENELVSCMGFGNRRINLGGVNKNNEYELLRFCNKINTNVIGAASKLLRYFENNYKPEKVISYYNNDYSNGNLYKTLGFTNKKLSNISYEYYNNSKQIIENRYKYRKSELIKLGYNKNSTEFEITEKIGLYRLYNSGTYRIEKTY